MSRRIPRPINVALDPGRGLRTGSHPTTRLVLAWLEREVGPRTVCSTTVAAPESSASRR
jgi:ribosomal protein L11 methylase PrmA